MWRQLELYNNQFLQQRVRWLEPETINTMVRKENQEVRKDRQLCVTPNLRSCLTSSYVNDHAELAYGFGALPKLLKELCNDNMNVQWRAINSLNEHLQNPLHAQRAITEFQVVRMVRNAFLRMRMRDKRLYVRSLNGLLSIFYTLAGYHNAANLISVRPYLLRDFYVMMDNNEVHKDKAAAILRRLSEKPDVCQFLLEYSSGFCSMAKMLKNDTCAPHSDDFWTHLSHFLELAPERGINLGFFGRLWRRVDGKTDKCHDICMKCFGLLLRCAKGQEKFDAVDGVKVLYDMLKRDYDTYEYIVFALQNGLLSKKSIWRAREFTHMPKILSYLAKDTDNKRLQLYCFTALRLMGEMPCIKQYMREVCMESLESIQNLDEFNECTRDDLIAWLKRNSDDTSE